MATATEMQRAVNRRLMAKDVSPRERRTLARELAEKRSEEDSHPEWDGRTSPANFIEAAHAAHNAKEGETSESHFLDYFAKTSPANRAVVTTYLNTGGSV
jgi:hypothetical protein